MDPRPEKLYYVRLPRLPLFDAQYLHDWPRLAQPHLRRLRL